VQKFQEFDLVKIADDLGEYMSHFTSGVEAIVLYSYREKYHCGSEKDYALYIRGKGHTAWYHEEQLTLVRPGAKDVRMQWEAEIEERVNRESDLDWIFENGLSVLSNQSIISLAKCLGIDNLWGPHGEGFVFCHNAQKIMAIAAPFLKKGDKAGWLKFCEKQKENKQCVS
jgi:hypothetical protein